MYSLLIAVLPLLARPVLSAPQNDLDRGLTVPDKTYPFADPSALTSQVDLEGVSKSHPVSRANKRRSLPPCPEGQVRKPRSKKAASPHRDDGKAAMSQGVVGTPNKVETAPEHTTAAQAGNKLAAVFKETKLLASDATSARESTTIPVTKPTTSATREVDASNRKTSPSSSIGEDDTPIKLRSGKRNVLYTSSWTPDVLFDTIPVDHVTHLLYAFACPNKTTGTVSYTDPIAAKRHLPKLYKLKKEHRNVKTLLSIGGHTCNDRFGFANEEAQRKEFTRSAMKLVVDGSFDGLDMDWEGDVKKDLLLELLKECRQELDKSTGERNPAHPFLLTAATQVTVDQYDISAMDSLLDHWFVMTYEFAGDWSVVASHQADLVQSKSYIQNYIDESHGGLNLSKVHLGLPLFGKKLNSTGLEKENGEVTGEKSELYKNLPKPGAKVYFDKENIATYSVDETKKEFYSYDDPQTIPAKAKYIQDKGLGGAFFWEAKGDRSGNESLVRLMSQQIGPLEQYPNWINPKPGFKIRV